MSLEIVREEQDDLPSQLVARLENKFPQLKLPHTRKEAFNEMAESLRRAGVKEQWWGMSF